MAKSNKSLGNAFEQRLCRILSEHDFWAHNLAQNSAGQPFDIIAAKKGRGYAIDCKVCAKDYFRLARIEENQASAMTLWRDTGNGEGWFALEMSDGSIYFLSYALLLRLSAVTPVLLSKNIKQYGKSLEEWVKNT